MYRRIRKLFLNYVSTLIKTFLLYRAPFLYPALEIEPSSCNLLITNRCNLKCVMCRQWRQPIVEDELSSEDWKRIITDLKKNGIRNIHFTGGEPLLRNDLCELISYSSQNGFVTGLTTNGILLRRDALEGFIDAGLRSIAVSMDGAKDAYERIRGVPNSFKKIEEAILITAKMKKKRKIDASINFTLMKDNIRELKNVKRFADEVGIPIAVCILDKNSYLFDVEENKSKFWISEGNDLEDLQEALGFLKSEKIKKPGSLIINFPAVDFIGGYFKDPRQAHIPCVSSQDRVIIDPYGYLLGGCMSMGSFGNVKDNPFSQLRKEKRYKTAKRNMFYKRCAGCSCGYLFNIRCFPPLIVNDLVERMRYHILGHVLSREVA